MKGRGKFRARFRKDQMKKGIFVLPNLFTTASLFAGVYALISSINEEFYRAAVAIIIALVLDGLDGRMARMTNTTSKFGTEYDSLSDLVAFGVAPATLAYTWALSSYGKWGWISAFIYVACGALRLARFNVQVNVVEKKVFNGLPIPAAALVVASSVILHHELMKAGFLEGMGTVQSMMIMFSIFGLSLLMVSSVKYYSFKDLNYFVRKPFMSFILIIFILIIVVAEPQITIFTFSFGYALSGPVWTVIKLIRRRHSEPEDIGHPVI